MAQLCDKNKCTGCGACLNICPLGCISMERDERGFDYPVIDKSKCSSCGLCQKACPEISALQAKFADDSEVYNGAITSREEILLSSSGGIAYGLAKTLLEKGGVVLGAAYDENMRVRHICVKSQKDLPLLQGSKYVQSDTGLCYRQARACLKENKPVLFIGLPCQIAGLYQYLGSQKYENLITCDLLCGGAPSPGLFEKYIKTLENKFQDKITRFNFRSKKYGYGFLLSEITTRKNKKILLRGTDAAFMRTLGTGYIRPSCFVCRYRSWRRTGDLTLGDFWNLDSQKGVSLILANTPRGSNFLLKDLAEKANLQRQTEKRAKASQDCSISPTKRKPADYEEFFASSKTLSWKALVKKYIYPKTSFKINLMENLPQGLACAIRKLIGRIKKNGN